MGREARLVEIGRRIREARESLGLNQEELALRIGLSQRAVSYAERQAWLSRRTLERYSRALQKPLSWFVREEHEVEPEEQAIERAFEVVRRDPEFGFGTRSSADFDLAAKREIVRLYERAKAVRLLPPGLE